MTDPPALRAPAEGHLCATQGARQPRAARHDGSPQRRASVAFDAARGLKGNGAPQGASRPRDWRQTTATTKSGPVPDAPSADDLPNEQRTLSPSRSSAGSGSPVAPRSDLFPPAEGDRAPAPWRASPKSRRPSAAVRHAPQGSQPPAEPAPNAGGRTSALRSGQGSSSCPDRRPGPPCQR